MSASGFDPMPVADVVGFFERSSDRFSELAALFDSIRKLAGDPSNGVQIAKLCKLGAYVSHDYENVFDCWREQVEKGGVRS